VRKRIRCIDYAPLICCGVDEVLPELVVAASGSSAGISAGTAAGIGIGATAAGVGGAAAGGAFGGGTFNSVTGLYDSPGQTAATGPAPAANPATSASASPGGTPAATTAPKSGPGLFQNAIKAIGPAIAGSLVSTGAQALFGGKRGVTVPPPPGAAQVDPEGAQAAAQIRARQAIAGGLQSTNNPAANSQQGYAAATSGPTSGGKTALGQ
jgi:type IV secretion system protein TrbL